MTGHVALTGAVRNGYRKWSENLKGSYFLEDLNINTRSIRWKLKEFRGYRPDSSRTEVYNH